MKKAEKAQRDLEHKRRDGAARVRKKDYLTKKQKLFAKLLPISSSGTQAAVSAGYSKDAATVVASQNLRKFNVVREIERVEKNMKEAFKDIGLDNDYLAAGFKHQIDYNSEKVIRVVGEGQSAREVEEMRDARTALTAIVQVAKIGGSSLENKAVNAVADVGQETAWLAIKSLLKKLNVEQLKQARDSIDAMLDGEARVVSET